MIGWFVCPTVSMVTTSKAAGMEKALFIFCQKNKRRIRRNIQPMWERCIVQIVLLGCGVWSGSQLHDISLHH